MPSLGETIATLAKSRRNWQHLTGASSGLHRTGRSGERPARLQAVADFGSNPGNLRMLQYVPAHRKGGSLPLVVVLHGCTQSAEDYDHGTGWSEVAEQCGFAVLFAEQKRQNNPNLCFNWFQPADMERGDGEPRSIVQMIEQMARNHAIDRNRVFVTGLSAGGAMASVMLATYPEVFAGGAIIAGLPYGAAHDVQEAFASMSQGRQFSAEKWGDAVRQASSHDGPWPAVSVWHGGSDRTVAPANAEAIVAQWANLHGLDRRHAKTEKADRLSRRSWSGADGRVLVEAFEIAGMGHGTPIAISGSDAAGHAGPFLLDVGISSTWHIARSWQLTGASAEAGEAEMSAQGKDVMLVPSPKADRANEADDRAKQSKSASPDVGGYVQGVINKALRSAGLLR